MEKRGAVNFMLPISEKRQLERSARDLGLPVAEFVRRSVRVALPVLTAVNYPGVTRVNRNETAGATAES